MKRLLLSIISFMVPFSVWSMEDPLVPSSSQSRALPVRDYYAEFKEEREKAVERGEAKGEMLAKLQIAGNMLTLLPSTTNEEIVALLKLPVETVADLRLKIIEQQKK